MSDAISRGVSVDVFLRLRRDAKIDSTLESAEKLLSNAGCQVTVRETPLTGLAVLDGKIVWYGTIPLLAHAKADDCSLRIVNAEAAEDLEKTLESLVH